MSDEAKQVLTMARGETIENDKTVDPDEHGQRVRDRVESLKVDREAKRQLAREAAGAIEIPPRMSLAQLARMPEEPEQFVIEGLWPVGGNVGFAAQRKYGKTTLVDNLVRSLADGDPFLDLFEVPVLKRVALLDFELSPNMLRRWLLDQGIRNADAVDVISLRGHARDFDIIDDVTRARWAERLRGTDVLILDPLKPIMSALGLNEWTDFGTIAGAFDALRVEAGIGAGLIAHHTGHEGERARGDSTFEGWADVLWYGTREDVTDLRSWRYFHAYGRDIDRERGLVSMYDHKRLAFAPEDDGAKEDRIVGEMVVRIGNDEVTTADILRFGLRGISKNTVSQYLKRAMDQGLLTMRIGEKNSRHYRRAL